MLYFIFLKHFFPFIRSVNHPLVKYRFKYSLVLSFIFIVLVGLFNIFFPLLLLYDDIVDK